MPNLKKTTKWIGLSSIRNLAGVLLATTLSATTARAGTTAPQAYALTDLGTLPGFTQESHATGLNNGGQVVGYSVKSQGTDASDFHAFLYSNGSLTDLNTLIPNPPVGSRANGINDAGQVILSTFYPTTRGSIYSGGVFQDLGTLGGSATIPAAINASGQVVGTSAYPGNSRFGTFLYSGGTLRDLNGPAGFNPKAINNSGVVVGIAIGANDNQIGWIYQNGSFQEVGNLGITGALDGVNSAGEAVGAETRGPGGITQAIEIDNGAIQGIGPATLDSAAHAINNQGQIIGAFWPNPNTASPVPFGFVYADGNLRDLNPLLVNAPGYHISDAIAINENGQIAADAITPSGETHAVLLTPTTVAAVPLPPAAWAALAALPLLVCGKRLFAIVAK